MTSVYFDHAKEQICTALDKLNQQIEVYIRERFQGRSGTARVGFSAEQEIFNIFRTIFGEELFGQKVFISARQSEKTVLPRRIMNELWNTIQLYRYVNDVDD